MPASYCTSMFSPSGGFLRAPGPRLAARAPSISIYADTTSDVATDSAHGVHPWFATLVMADTGGGAQSAGTTLAADDVAAGAHPTTAPADDARTASNDGGGPRTTPWYLRPLRGSGWAYYLFVSSIVTLCGILVHSTWWQALTVLAKLCNSLTRLEVSVFRALVTIITIALAVGATPDTVRTVFNIRVVDARAAAVKLADDVVTRGDGTTVDARAAQTAYGAGSRLRTRMDSGAVQTMFPHESFFPDGVAAPKMRTVVRVADDRCVAATGVGDARVGKWENGTMHEITYSNSLLVPELGEALVSEPQCRAAGVEVRFYTHCDLIFHKHGGARVTFDADNTMEVELLPPPAAASARAAGISRAPYGNVITKGRIGARESALARVSNGSARTPSTTPPGAPRTPRRTPRAAAPCP